MNCSAGERSSYCHDAPVIVSEQRNRIGLAITLTRQLDELSSATAEQLRLLKSAIPPVQHLSGKPGFIGKLFGRRQTEESAAPSKPRLAEAAEVGLQIFRELAGKACEYCLPILLHF